MSPDGRLEQVPQSAQEEQQRRRHPRLVALAALALLLLIYPFVVLVDGDARVAGLPLLPAYLFGVWAAVIGLAAWLSRRS